MSNGFSRRCETGASSEVTGAAPFGSAPKVRCPLAEYTPLSDRETDPADRSRARCGRVRDHLEPVRAAVEAGPRRAPADRLDDDGSGRRGGALERARERHAQRNANGGARAQEEVSRSRGEPDGRRPFGLALDPDPDPDRPGREVPDEQLLRAVPAGPWGLAEGEAPRLDRDLAGCGGTGVDDARALRRDRLARDRSGRLREQ